MIPARTRSSLVSQFFSVRSRAGVSRRRGLLVPTAADLLDDLLRPRFADRAVAIVNPALRQREVAPTRAAFGIEAMQRRLLLLGSQLREIDAGKLAGTIRMGKKNLSGIIEGFHSRVNRQSQQRADFHLIKRGIA